MEPVQNLSYRYPGTKPFDANERALFNGRDTDIRNLQQSLLQQNLLVLYSRSGLGKSSLLNAGLVTAIEADTSIDAIPLRLGAYYDGIAQQPSEILFNSITREFPDYQDSFLYAKILDGRKDIAQNRLWYLLKSQQIREPQRKCFILIFDQFEELFTYRNSEVQHFAKELSQLFFVSIPQQLQNILKEKLASDEDFMSDEEVESLYKPLNIKILFSLRSDKMSLLNSLSASFPAILKNCYELNPLNRDQAKEAIEKPAQLTDKTYLSPPFTFTTDALNLVLDELTNAKAESFSDRQEIETFQLQIVCKYAENLVVDKGIKQVTSADLGNIKTIFENHYRNIISKLDPESRLPARQLLEEKLIVDGIRVSMPVVVILKDMKEQGMTHDLLEKLIDTHILRREQNNTVEVSHDTLIEPILRFYEERRRQDADNVELAKKEAEIVRIKAEQEQQMALQRGKRKRVIRWSIVGFLAIIVAFIFYGYQNARHRKNQLKSFLAIQSQAMQNDDPTVAMNLAFAAMEVEDDSLNTNAAYRMFLENVFYKNIVTVKPKSFLSVARDGSKIISGSDDGHDSVWTTAGVFQYAFKDKSRLRAVDFTKGGDTILTGTVDGELALRKSNGELIKILMKNEGSKITTALFSPNQKQILVRYEREFEVLILDMTGKITATIGTGMAVNGIFSPNGQLILTGSMDGTAKLWTLDGHLISSHNTNDGPIMSLCFTEDGSIFFAGSSYSGLVTIWPTLKVSEWPISIFSTGIQVSSISTNINVDSFKYDTDGSITNTNLFVHTGNMSKGIINTWHLTYQNAIFHFAKDHELKGHDGTVHIIVDKEMLLTNTDDGTVKKWLRGGIWAEHHLTKGQTNLNPLEKKQLMRRFMESNLIEGLTEEEKKKYHISE